MNVTFSVQLIPDKFQLHQVSKDAVLQQILPNLLKSIKADNPNLKEYRVLIAYQLVDADTEVSGLVRNAVTAQQDTQLRPETSGFYLLFVEPPKNSTKLELSLLDGRHLAVLDGQDEYLLGRRDEQSKIKPQIDLTPFLGENELKVSREQAILYFADEKWKLKLHNNARVAVFLDQEKLEKNRSYDIPEEAILKLGNDPNNPVLRVLAHVVTN